MFLYLCWVLNFLESLNFIQFNVKKNKLYVSVARDRILVFKFYDKKQWTKIYIITLGYKILQLP